VVRRRYISGHVERQPGFIEREMREILGIEKEFADYEKKQRRSR